MTGQRMDPATFAEEYKKCNLTASDIQANIYHVTAQDGNQVEVMVPTNRDEDVMQTAGGVSFTGDNCSVV